MRITLTGATGFVGRALCETLAAQGHDLQDLTRNPDLARGLLPTSAEAVAYDSPDAFSSADAVINLAGESVVGLWTAAKRRKIRDSRVLGTQRLVESLASRKTQPSVLISASAIGYYGDRGDEILTESSRPGEGFLAETSIEWESAALQAEDLGIRTAVLRIGIVLETGGGALGSMLTPAKLGLGGPLGSGKQWWSWIHRDDLIGLILHCLNDERITGPVNATAPEPMQQGLFAKTLGSVLHRPAFLPAPAFVLRTVLGGFSEELLSSKRVLPQAALDSGYAFQHRSLSGALKAIL